MSQPRGHPAATQGQAGGEAVPKYRACTTAPDSLPTRNLFQDFSFLLFRLQQHNQELMERRSPCSEQGTSAPPQLRHTRCHPGSGTFFLTRMLHLGPSLPPCPQHEDIILGGWSLVWPQIQAYWMDSGVCLQGLGEIPVVRTLLPHTWIWQGPDRSVGRLHPWAQLWPPTRPVWPAKATIHGKGVEKNCGAGLCTAHIPLGILFCAYFGGCSQRKSVTRRGLEPLLAPAGHLKGSSGTDTRPTDPQPRPRQAIQLFCK